MSHNQRRAFPTLSPPSLPTIVILVIVSACAAVEDEHDWFGQQGAELMLDGGHAPIRVDIDADTVGGAERDRTDDTKILYAAQATWNLAVTESDSCKVWYVSAAATHGDENGTGTQQNPWRTLHHAMWALTTQPTRPDCGVIYLQWTPGASETVYPAHSGISNEPIELKTFGDGRASDRHLVIRGQVMECTQQEEQSGILCPKRPKIVFDPPDMVGSVDVSREFLTIRHSNWTIHDIEVDFNGHGGRGIRIFSGSAGIDYGLHSFGGISPYSADDVLMGELTENIVIRDMHIHGIRGCSTYSGARAKADAVLIAGPHGSQLSWNGTSKTSTSQTTYLKTSFCPTTRQERPQEMDRARQTITIAATHLGF